MTKKKTAAAVAVAVGLSATATGSYAAVSPSEGSGDAVAKTAERAAVKVDRSQSAAADRSSTAQDGERRRCVTAKRMRKIKLFMTHKRAMKRLPKPTRRSQSGGLRFRYFNACTSSLKTDFDLVFKKRGKGKNRKWRVYDISVYWR